MKFYLIGKPLGHSISPEIHARLAFLDYSLKEIEKEDLPAFLKERDFAGLNVTIPYKKEVMAYLDAIDPAAKRIGAVNTIVNDNGILTGYNTDCLGFKNMLERNHICLEGKNILILGTGGASLAVKEAVTSLGGSAQRVSRSEKEEAISYEEMYEREAEFEILINTTPVGMAPLCDAVPIDLDRLTSLEAVVDIIANPLRTRLVYEAEKKGLKACGGLEMLVGQAFCADELFLNKKMDPALLDKCLSNLLRAKRNLVLIGMPSAGKTTIGKMLSQKMNMPLVEMDDMITEEIGMTIAEYFALEGEKAFRDRESEVCLKLVNTNGNIISTGGGVIKREENIRALAANGILVWIDRDTDLLFGSKDRPLSRSKDDIDRLYEERKELYEKYSDVIIRNNGSLAEVIKEMEEL